MDWRQIALIWILCVIIGGLICTGVVLWFTRDGARRGQRRKPAREQRADTLKRWQASMDGARERAEQRARQAAVTYAQRVTALSDRLAGAPSAEALRRLPASLTESRERVCDAVGLWQIVATQQDYLPAPAPPTPAEAANALHAWYAAREAEQTIALLDAGMVKWPA